MVEKLIKLNQKGSVGRRVGTNNELPASRRHIPGCTLTLKYNCIRN